MVGKIIPKQPHERIVANHHASKTTAVARRPAQPIKKKEGAGLADLRDVDKTKVARLINHVMMAFKEIQRLKELLELERKTHETLVTKLQQQNHEVATELSQLQLKLASLQMMSPLPSQKVYLHPGGPPTLSPIREGECFEAESEVIQTLEPDSSAETTSVLREEENGCNDLETSRRQDKCILETSEETKQHDESAQAREFQACHSPTVFESQGKENRCPELLQQCKGDTLIKKITDEEDAGVLPKRPPPRPLPDLLRNILHRCKDFGCVPVEVDGPKASVNNACKREDLITSTPILHGYLKPKLQPLPSQLTKPLASCSSLHLDPSTLGSGVATSSSHGLQDLSTDLHGEQASYPFHVPCEPPAKASSAIGVDLRHDCNSRVEAKEEDVIDGTRLEGGRHENSTFVEHTQCKCTAFPHCPPSCLPHMSSNLTQAPSLKQLGGSEKVQTTVCNQEDIIEPNTRAGHRKLRFDPTAGEEGIFYYTSDVEKNAKGNLDSGVLQPTSLGDSQCGHLGGTEQTSSSMPSVEGQALDRDILESHWTREAIERRNSFHRIPIMSPRSTDASDEHEHQEQRLVLDGLATKITENESGREECLSKGKGQTSSSEIEVCSERNERPCPSKSRRSSCRTSKWINCSTIVPPKSRRALLASKHFAKYPRRCSKCCSIVDPMPRTQSTQESNAHKGCRTRSDIRTTKGKLDRQGLGTTTETVGSETEDGVNVSEPSTLFCSGDIARCEKCATRLPQKPKRGRARMRSVPVSKEESDPTSMVYCVASEDMYLSTHSSTDYSTKARRHAPTFPLKLCKIHTRKVKKQHRSGQGMKSVRLLNDQSSSGPSQRAFYMDRKILNMMLQSNGKYRKGPLADATKCKIETWRFGKLHQSSDKESTREDLEHSSKVGSESLPQHERVDVESDSRKVSTRTRDGQQRARRWYHHIQGRKQNLEKWKNFEVDDLLDQFLQSNAECAAELIKCSVYLESTTSSRPSSQGTLMREKAIDDPPASKFAFQNSMAIEEGSESCSASFDAVQPRREPFCADRNELTCAQLCLEQSARCSKCGDCIKPSIEVVETKELGDLCDICSAPVTPEKIKLLRKSASLWPDESRQSADVAPIVLPWTSSDHAPKVDEGGMPLKSTTPPRSSTTLICNVKKSGDWASQTLHEPPDLSNEDHRMPIITGVSVSSRLSTPPRETDEPDTAKELTEMFDMSLYDLVNDLEGQRRDYWRRVNSHSMEEVQRVRKQCNDGRQVMDVEKVQRQSTTRRLLPRKKVHASHFR